MYNKLSHKSITCNKTILTIIKIFHVFESEVDLFGPPTHTHTTMITKSDQKLVSIQWF